MPSCASPFLEIDPTEWFCSNALCFAIPDHKPASRGHLLIITRRHVATWFDCTLPEQNDLMALVNQAKILLDQQLDPKPDGYQVLFNSGAAAGQTVPHAHVHLIPRYTDGTAGPCGSAKPEALEQASPGGNLPQLAPNCRISSWFRKTTRLTDVQRRFFVGRTPPSANGSPWSNGYIPATTLVAFRPPRTNTRPPLPGMHTHGPS
jgi:diadenosine tetraphosphate (Ap4A) HIT family hydrolase